MSLELRMKKRVLIQILITILMIVLPVFAAEYTIAVLDFENNSFLNSEEYQPLAKGLSEIMITELNQVQAIQVVERQNDRLQSKYGSTIYRYQSCDRI